MLPIRNVTNTNVIYTKCYIDEMLPIQSVLYEMLPRPNVTIRKCNIQNVTDPKILLMVYTRKCIFKNEENKNSVLSKLQRSIEKHVEKSKNTRI